MLLLKTTARFTNTNLPIYQPTAGEAAVAAIPNLALWLEAGAGYFQTTSGVFAAWVDRVSGRRFIPAQATAPLIVTAGQRKVLRFGFSGALTVANNGVLREEANSDLYTLTGYSEGLLVRIPISSSQGGTELPAGVNAGGAVVGTAVDSTGLSISVNNLGQFGARQAANVAPQVSSSVPRADDALWHYWVISYDYTGKVMVLRKDGVEVSRNPAVTLETADVAGAKKKIIAGSGTAYSGTHFAGEIGADLTFPSLAIHNSPTHLAALETYLAALKAQATA